MIMVSVVYGQNRGDAARIESTQGKVARYARGGDYHALIWRKLEELLEWLRAECPGVRGRAVADTAPLLERDFARLAGLGWIGKNTMLIDRRLGSFTFLGALWSTSSSSTTRRMMPTTAEAARCCLDLCPTQAFTGPYQLDARRCISYWTIEHRGAIPETKASELDGWVFGCDVCQDVCPWNRKAPQGHHAELDARPEWTDPDLIEWLRARSQNGEPCSRGPRSCVRSDRGWSAMPRWCWGAEGCPKRPSPWQRGLTIGKKTRWCAARRRGRWADRTEPARAALLRHQQDPDQLVRDAVSAALAASTPCQE